MGVRQKRTRSLIYNIRSYGRFDVPTVTVCDWMFEKLGIEPMKESISVYQCP